MTFSPASLDLPRTTELRDRLMGWCDVNSGSDHRAGLDRMRAILAEALRTFPGRFEEIDLGAGQPKALRVRCREEAPIQVLLNAHYDTVYGATHPFQHCELLDADTLRGPGVVDDKGGILVLLTALQAFEKLRGEKEVGWEILLGPDEEIGSPASEPMYRDAAARHHFALVFEPCRENGDLIRARKGTGVFTATCRGRAAHAGRDPENGRNAILALAEYLLQAAKLPSELPDVMLNIGNIRGGGAVNIVPDLASAELNARVSRISDADKVIARLRELAAPINAREGLQLEITGQFNRPPMENTPETDALFAAYQDCGHALNLSFGRQDVGGGSDGNLLQAAGLPVLDGVGVLGGGMHSEREWIRLSSIAERARLTALFLARLNAGEIRLPDSIRRRQLACG